MRTIRVAAPSASYDVQIGPGLLDSLGEKVRACTKAKRCVLVSGENVFPLYGQRALESLRGAGLDAEALVFPSGEETKSLARYGELLNFIAEKRLTRSDCLVALGGGVTGDLCGFAAATYQRGIPYIQVPTTLLAAVDSSVGGKTAVNLPAGKNQVGAFYQPSLVLCDTDTLKTLPERQLRAGYAEVIKYAVLGDPDLFDLLQQKTGDVGEIIEICVRMKAEIVEEDERDTGRRRLLNLGHSFGHAVESRSGYTLLHGEAVAVGLAMVARAAVKRQLLDRGSMEAIVELLRAYGLPTETDYAPEELMETLLLDKKISGGKLHLIVPRFIGMCDILPAGPEELPAWLADGCAGETENE
ncbi:MAG: 3-dehydroquinate synthase [Oscillospiraceae bacterium]|nr:3-dehydroquinate synthase [Oscillospiraceae bacterium]